MQSFAVMVKYLIIYILITILASFVLIQAVPEHGPFNVTVSGFKLCKGPKRRECSLYSGKLLNETQLVFDIDVVENVGNVEGNIVVTSKKNKWKLPLKKLCDHTFWKPFLETYFSFKKCVIQKGKYHMEFNMQDLVRKYYGGSFIYGTWNIKAMFYNNVCNFGCTITDILLTPQ